LQNYNFTIRYRPGKTNVVADALSRIPELHEMQYVARMKLPIDQLNKEYQADDYFAPILKTLQDPSKAEPRSITIAARFRLINGLPYYQSPTEPPRLCIPKGELRAQILHDHHDAPISGHLGIDKTLRGIAAKFFWPKMAKDIKAYVTTCEACQRNKSTTQYPAGLLQPLPTPGRRWEQVTMDFIVQLPKTKSGFDAIMVVVDRLTKRVHFLPTTTNASAPDIAKLFFNQVFRLHGLPQVIISDRDPKFVSKFWKTLFKQLGTKISLSTAHHPQTDGQTERANRTLEDMLRAFVNYKQDNWDDCLSAAEFAYNNSTQASTGYTPFHLDCGQTPIVPSSLLNQTLYPSNVDSVEDFMSNWRTMITIAKDSLTEAQDRQAKYANKKRRDDRFNIGDKVYLSTAHLSPPTEKQRPLKKLQPKYIGPYEIEKVISTTAYKLKLPHDLKMHPVFHISLLKRYHQEAPEKFPHRRRDPPPPVIYRDQDEPEFEVQEILNKRTFYSKTQYLVQWKGYERHDATWEPVTNLTHCRALIRRYEEQQ
jgi:transposase InsO family protein